MKQLSQSRKTLTRSGGAASCCAPAKAVEGQARTVSATHTIGRVRIRKRYTRADTTERKVLFRPPPGGGSRQGRMASSAGLPLPHGVERVHEHQDVQEQVV